MTQENPVSPYYLAGAVLVLAGLLGCSATEDPRDEPSPRPVAALTGLDLPAFMDCAREQNATLLQAHRAGDRPGAAENSLGALNASLSDGAVFIEIDVAQSADGVLLLMHDDTLERTTTGSGLVNEQLYDDLSHLELVDLTGRATGETIPTLSAALDALSGRGIAQIDRKRSVSLEAIAQQLEAHQAVDRAIVITYTLDDAIALHQRLPGVMISTSIRSLDEIETLQKAGIDLTRLTAWLGLGDGNPALDKALDNLGIETTYGDFRAERDGTVDYQHMAARGAEVISVDEVANAAAALDAPRQLTNLLDSCHTR